MPIHLNTHPSVPPVFECYPAAAQKKLAQLRELILETAKETGSITELEETLKWGEPSYLAEKGSTIRIDWKEKNPGQVALYFKCTSKLVSTFREVFGARFQYEKDRALLFDLDKPFPEAELKQCIAAALTYHRVKQLPNLGISRPSD